MILKEMNIQLYESLRDFRTRYVKELIEPPVVTDTNTSVSKIIGIFTEKKEASAGAGHARITASDIMTPSPVTIITKDRVSTAKDIMIRHRIDHLPVVEKERKGAPTLKRILTSNHVLECMLPSERIGR